MGDRMNARLIPGPAQEEMKTLVGLGLHIGINGCALKEEQGLKMAAAIPLDKLVLETDAPWCTVRPSAAGTK